MALTDDQRGPQAAWLYHGRVAMFGKGDAALDALAEKLRDRGAYRAPDTIKGWEASEARAPIPPDVLPHLEAVLDSTAPVRSRPFQPQDLMVALAAQTAAITALVTELQVDRSEREALEARLRAVEAELRPHGQRGSGASQERRVPLGTTG